MTTVSWSTRIRHDSDAMFREWGLELNTRLASAGLVQTADTGQVNWVTVTRAGVNANAGYEIWRMNDTAQATAPVFFRLDYGTGSNASAPRVQITVGTGSNGTGTITGTALSTARSAIEGSTAHNADTLRNSYVCVNQGFFGLNWKQGTNAEGMFIFCRSCDSSGTPDTVGGTALWQPTNLVNQAFRYAATAAAYTAVSGANQTGVCANWQQFTSTLVGTDTQVELCWSRHPRTTPIFGLLGVLDTEYTTGNTFPATPVGSTSRTFIALTSTRLIHIGGGTGLKAAILWE